MRPKLIKTSIFQTTTTFLKYTFFISLLFLFIHSMGQTYYFTSNYFEAPNLYDIWEPFDKITHSLGGMFFISMVLLLNFRSTFRVKAIISLFVLMWIGIFWEIIEFGIAPFMNWMSFDFTDMAVDLYMDFLGASTSLMFYLITMIKFKGVKKFEWRRRHKSDSVRSKTTRRKTSRRNA